MHALKYTWKLLLGFFKPPLGALFSSWNKTRTVSFFVQQLIDTHQHRHTTDTRSHDSTLWVYLLGGSGRNYGSFCRFSCSLSGLHLVTLQRTKQGDLFQTVYPIFVKRASWRTFPLYRMHEN